MALCTLDRSACLSDIHLNLFDFIHDAHNTGKVGNATAEEFMVGQVLVSVKHILNPYLSSSAVLQVLLRTISCGCGFGH